LATYYQLSEVIKGHQAKLQQQAEDGEANTKPFGIALPEIELPQFRVEIPKDGDGPKLYVRDDGTVDWDGALQDRAALKKFGAAVWARINGQDPESLDNQLQIEEAERNRQNMVTARIEETPAIREEKARLDVLTNELADVQAAHTALLNSGEYYVRYCQIRDLAVNNRDSSRTCRKCLYDAHYSHQCRSSCCQCELGNTQSRASY
jgi:hypothetical protein